MKILVINGPNLDMLGRRDSKFYGTLTLKQLNKSVKEYAKQMGCRVSFFQSNCEGKLISAVTKAKSDAIIINPGAYSHTSYALRDAIECFGKNVVEVHLSDIMNREDFRKIRVLKDIVSNCFYGKNKESYFEAINYLISKEEK